MPFAGVAAGVIDLIQAEHLAQAAVAREGFYLGLGIANLVTLYTPDMIVLGGGVACGRGERLWIGIREVLASHLRLVPTPALCLSKLGYHTALMGAIAVAIHGLDARET